MTVKRSQTKPVLASSAPLSVYVVLRNLEAAYAKQAASLDRARADNKKLRQQLKQGQS